MRFKLIDQAKKEFPVHRLCTVLGVSESGYFAWKGRAASRRQNEDLVLLAHIRSQSARPMRPMVRPACMSSLRKTVLMSGGIALPG